MGFYGRIANSNKTAFSFDRIYSTRSAMDLACTSDEVFIGRYVLVEYDEPPITGYYNGTNFYNSNTYYPQSMITPRQGIVYQDLTHKDASYTFYEYVEGTGYVPLPTSITTSYAGSYNIDVTKYGRGYDSTAWMKTFDTTTGKYKYVLISELNTIVPTFHMITDPPSDSPTAPYFDLDTTTVDYYLHAQADWGQSIRLYNQEQLFNGDPAKDVIDISDEDIVYSHVTWTADPNGVQSFDRINNAQGRGDIYYNKSGFDPEQRTYVTGNAQEAAEHLSTYYHKDLTNTINYDMNYSGRKYMGNIRGNEWNSGSIYKDRIEWYVHLPVIGNTICSIWDRMYGYDSNGRRYTHLAQGRSDVDYTVTYNTETALGCINKIRDVLGWVLLPKSDIAITPAQDGSIYTLQEADTRYLYYTLKDPTATQGGVVTKEEQVIDKYYYFTYYPIYVIATQDANDPDVWSYSSGGDTITGTGDDIFYLDDDGLYKHPQSSIYRQINSDGSVTDPKYNTFYMTQPQWKLVELEEYNSDTLYGLLIQLHKLLGDYSPDTRDENSILGVINIAKDMIDNIDKLIKPHRIAFTDADGQITTQKTTHYHNNDNYDVEIEFPYFASADQQELLDCYGHWRLPVTYKLEEYSSMNTVQTTKWFDNGYYGNSLLHEIYATDTIGAALRKMENDIADSHYKPQEILTFTAQATNPGEASSQYKYIENGSSLRATTLNYTLNKGPRQSISLTRTTPAGAQAIYSQSNIAPDYFVDNRQNYLASATGTYTDEEVLAWNANNANSNIIWTLSVTDERSQTATATTQITYADKIYWFTGAYIDTASSFTNLATLTSFASNLTSTLTLEKISPKGHIRVGIDKYFYYFFPSRLGDNEDFFELGGFRGGMDYLGRVNFTNGNNYTTEYKLWRSTNCNLGLTTFTALKEG